MKTKLIIISILFTFILISCSENRNILDDNNNSFVDKKIESPFYGNKDSKVQMTIFTDFQCPACIQFEKNIWEQVIEKYAQTNKIGVTYKMFPLSFHKNAPEDALAALCATSQWKYSDFSKEMYALEEEKKWANITFEERINIAKNIWINEQKFKQCIDEWNYVSKIKEDMELWNKIWLRGTPSIYLNGELMEFSSREEFFNILDSKLLK